jgi:hypothetical protein
MKIIPSSEDVLALFITSSTFHHLFTTFFLMAASFVFIMSFFFSNLSDSLSTHFRPQARRLKTTAVQSVNYRPPASAPTQPMPLPTVNQFLVHRTIIGNITTV